MQANKVSRAKIGQPSYKLMMAEAKNYKYRISQLLSLIPLRVNTLGWDI